MVTTDTGIGRNRDRSPFVTKNGLLRKIVSCLLISAITFDIALPLVPCDELENE